MSPLRRRLAVWAVRVTRRPLSTNAPRRRRSLHGLLWALTGIVIPPALRARARALWPH